MSEKVCCITNKRKTAKNEWENGITLTLFKLYTVYIKK